MRAMSIFCPHCKKRLILEDFKITSYHAVREFATCGNVVIEKRGHVAAAVKAEHLVIKGKMHGRVCAKGGVVIHKTGSCLADIESPTVQIEGGAVINGFLCIGRVALPGGEEAESNDPSAMPTTEAQSDAARSGRGKRRPPSQGSGSKRAASGPNRPASSKTRRKKS